MTITDRLAGVNEGVAIKAPCRVATTANVALTGLLTIDGVTVAAGDRVLVKEQTTASENGIYVVAAGAWERALDFNGTRDVVQGTMVAVLSGTVNGETLFSLDTASPVIGTSSLSFSPALGASSEFTQTGTGAVSRTIADKLKEAYSVKDFGAAGDDSTDDTTAFQNALNAINSAGGGYLYVPVGTYRISSQLLVYSNTQIFGSGHGSVIKPTSALAISLTAVFRNANISISAAGQRNDSNILISDLKFDCSLRPYPEYLEDGNGDAVVNPGQDPTRNESTYSTSGYCIWFVNASYVRVENCYFVDHGSFTVAFSGCLLSGTRNNLFFRCGRVSSGSPCIYIGHSGTFRTVTAVTKGSDTVFSLDRANASVTGASTVYIAKVRGLSRLITDGTYAVKSSSTYSVTIEDDTSAGEEFVFDGRAWIGTETTTFSEHCWSENDQGFSLNRHLLQIGGAYHTRVLNPALRNAKESGIYLIYAHDTTIVNAQIENVDMSDIVSAALEINMCTNTKISNSIFRNTQTYAVSIVGAVGVEFDNVTIIDPADNPNLTMPYGPFGESGSVTVSLTTSTGSAAATVASATGLSDGMIVVSPNVPAGVTATFSGTNVTLSSGTSVIAGTATARFNPSDGPGTTPADYKRYPFFITSFGLYPVTGLKVRNVRVQDFVYNSLGGFYLSRSAAAASAQTNSIKNSEFTNIDLRQLGRRGRITNVSNAAAAVITTDADHGLRTGSTVYIRGVAGPTGVNGGPRSVTVLTATTFSVAVNTSSANTFVASQVALWGNIDPDNDFYHYSGTTASTAGSSVDMASVVVRDVKGSRFSSLPLVEQFSPNGTFQKWRLPWGATRCLIELQGGGGGGGGGARTASGSASSGGGGGGGGGYLSALLIGQNMPKTVFGTITTNGTTTATVGSATGLYEGMYVTSANIAEGTVISTLSGTTATLSTAATGTGTSTYAEFDNGIYVGAGGTGGDGATSNGVAGTNGTAGVASYFNEMLVAYGGGLGAGGQLAANSGGGGGAGVLVAGGNASGATAGAASASQGSVAGGSAAAGGNGVTGGGGGGGSTNGAAGSAGGAGLIRLGAGGGGAGGGCSTAPGAFDGGNGGRAPGYYTAIAGGTAGAAGATPTEIDGQSGGGGGGGASSTSATGGAGGYGVLGGGGGGGGSGVGNNGGRGGNGGAGFVRITTFFD